MSRLLVIDPGSESGIVLGHYTTRTALTITERYQIPGGLMSVVAWFEQTKPKFDTLVCEKFTPYQSLTLASAEPLRIEGWLVGTGKIPDYKNQEFWPQPAAQYFMADSGDSLATKKKKAREFLKKHDLYVTGGKVGRKDSNDVTSATLHAIWYMVKIRHMPTMKKYFGESFG